MPVSAKDKREKLCFLSCSIDSPSVWQCFRGAAPTVTVKHCSRWWTRLPVITDAQCMSPLYCMGSINTNACNSADLMCFMLLIFTVTAKKTFPEKRNVIFLQQNTKQTRFLFKKQRIHTSCTEKTECVRWDVSSAALQMDLTLKPIAWNIHVVSTREKIQVKIQKQVVEIKIFICCR